MMILMNLVEIQEELFRQEYPQLLAGSDPDIERYCYLRSSGQGREALNIYQLHLKPRYPDDTLRMALLHSYRRRDPLYPRLLAVGYRRLAERALERVRKLIDYISAKIRSCNTQDVYSTIKTIEDILRFFPREQYEAISGMDRTYRYAQVLDFQVKPMEQAAEMVRSYLSRSLPVLEKERRRRQQAQIQRENSPALVDFSAVVFSREDLERIEISPQLSRFEDQTLAYCAKYWNLIDDMSFEQILFLYSRKYRTKNHTVYLAIRQGRRAGHRDEEILTSVMSLLVTGYYYSIQGDRYLQQRWQGIKFDMDRAVQAVKNAVPAKPTPATKPTPAKPVPAGRPLARSAPVKPAAPAAKPVPAAEQKPAAEQQSAPARSSVPVKPAVEQRPAAAKSAVPARPVAESGPAAVGPPIPAPTAKRGPAAKPLARSAPVKPAAPAAKPPPQPPVPAPAVEQRPVVPVKPAALAAAVEQKPPTPAKPLTPAAKSVPVKPEAPARESPVREIVPVRRSRPAGKTAVPVVPPAEGSVSDRLRKLSGRSYDLYQDRFLAQARPAIRKILGAGRGLFFNLPEKAEDLVYGYLRDHYADPYMNWAESDESRQLAEQGFRLSSLNPVIDECFRRIK
jgi:hypothetical protein